MKEFQPENAAQLERELARVMELISAGTIDDIDDLDPSDLALLIRRHGTQEEVERLIDRFTGPPDA